MIDANANRAREALRVLEDAARFAGGLGSMAARLKAMRHRLREALAPLDAELLSRARDVDGDPGREVSMPSEGRRADEADVAAAAGSRLAEALRSIEEHLKVAAPGSMAAEAVERLRYESYEIAPLVVRSLAARRPRQWRCCLLLTIADCRGDWRTTLGEALAGGIDAVQVREKGLGDRILLDHLREVLDAARPEGAAIVVNDRIDLALAAETDGVQLGRGDLPIARARAIAGEDLVIGASTHDLAEARSAIEAGADMLGIGCMFPSSTKPELECAGPGTLAEVLGAMPDVRHLAIGGVSPENIGTLVAAGARGVAVGRAITGSEDPRGTAERLVEAFASRPRVEPTAEGLRP